MIIFENIYKKIIDCVKDKYRYIYICGSNFFELFFRTFKCFESLRIYIIIIKHDKEIGWITYIIK